MEGRTVSHYEVLERLGGGGMGVVYKARDTHLDRYVALKFLPPELTRDDGAHERFIQEARAASALDHPNICTIYDIDGTPEGQQFIAMAFYDGETLKKRLERGPLPIDEAVDIALQVTSGLAEAHAAGIVHRDVKPANIMLTAGGLVKLVDFGIAKLTGVTGPTEDGTTMGTVSYLSPEQVKGDDADEQSDIWAVGVLMYQLLTGQRPFGGQVASVQIDAILRKTPPSPSELRAEVSRELDAIVNRALHKERSGRYATATELHDDLTRQRAALTAPSTTAGVAAVQQPTRRVGMAVPAAVVLLLAGAAAFWVWSRGADARWARDEAIPEVLRLIDGGNNIAAFALAERAAVFLPDDARLADALPRMSLPISLDTSPAGADVYIRDYADTDGEGQLIGTTPLVDVLVPTGNLRWDLRREGSERVSLAGPPQMWTAPILEVGTVILPEPGRLPDDMVRVPGGAIMAWLTGLDPFGNTVEIDDFLIDRFEVTNAQFKAFVDADGYQNREHWKHDFSADGEVLPWDEGIRQFVDTTGRPGPSTWELGDYREGQGNHPVTGISWYEAAAYAAFTGKQLPTISHWIRAAETRVSSFLTPVSNLQGNGPRAVGDSNAISMFGVDDMAGNVREWCWNLSGEQRFILGAAWTDPSYLVTYANVQSPFDRSPINGLRLVQYLDGHGVPPSAADPVELLTRDYGEEVPVADDVFEIYREQFSYDDTEITAATEPLPSTDDWTGERVTVDAAYGDEQLIVDVYLPTGSSPPYQAVVWFPGSDAILSTVSPPPTANEDFLLQSGRALIRPVLKGTYERREDIASTWPNETVRYAEYLVSWVKDVQRAIDYVETRDNIDADRLAFYGFSFGARNGAIIAAVEPRFKTAVLYSGGLASGRARPEVDQINYVSRVTMPTLMLNGLYDPVEPVEAAQQPMFELLGTPDADKKWVRLDAGHILPRNALIRETLDWLDTYLGPVN